MNELSIIDEFTILLFHQLEIGSHLLMTAGGNPKTGKTEILYRTSSDWTKFSPLNEAISGHQTVFTNNAVFVTGGYNGKIRNPLKILLMIT